MSEQFFEVKCDPPDGKFAHPDKVAQIGMDIFKQTTAGAVMVLHPAVIENTPHAFGYLRNSIQPIPPIVSANEIIGQVTTPIPYARPVETGSKPHWAPIAPLLLWAQRKFGDVKIAYIARAAIARRGGRAHRMFAKGWTAKKGTVERLYSEGVDKFFKAIQSI